MSLSSNPYMDPILYEPSKLKSKSKSIEEEEESMVSIPSEHTDNPAHFIISGFIGRNRKKIIKVAIAMVIIAVMIGLMIYFVEEMNKFNPTIEKINKKERTDLEKSKYGDFKLGNENIDSVRKKNKLKFI